MPRLGCVGGFVHRTKVEHSFAATSLGDVRKSINGPANMQALEWYVLQVCQGSFRRSALNAARRCDPIGRPGGNAGEDLAS